LPIVPGRLIFGGSKLGKEEGIGLEGLIFGGSKLGKEEGIGLEGLIFGGSKLVGSFGVDPVVGSPVNEIGPFMEEAKALPALERPPVAPETIWLAVDCAFWASVWR